MLNQDPADAASPEELALMDATISTLKASNPTLKSTLKARTAKLAVLKSAPTTPELQNMVDTLRTQNAAKAEKLASFKSGNVQMFSKEEMAAVEKAFKYWGARRRARKAAYEELEYAVMGSGKSREEIREDCGVEVD
jgi:26S proteasome regulatory subunit (ATPase 3-interacting protein)